MKRFSKIYKLALVASLAVPFLVHAQTAEALCSASGYTVETINGIFTTENGARDNKNALESQLPRTYNGQPLTVSFLLNPMHFGGILDLSDAAVQKDFEDETVKDYDLVEILNHASSDVKTQKLLLVGHSQGNFYANSFYDVVAGQPGGLPTESVGVYSVATPSDRVAGNGDWITSKTDKIIAGIIANVPFKKIKPAQANVVLRPGDDFWGHDFAKIYMQYLGTDIVSGVEKSLDKLSVDLNRTQDAICITPPQITAVHEIERAVFAVVDPVANPIGLGIFWGTKEAIDGTAFLGNTITSGIASILGSTTNIRSNNLADAVLALDRAQGDSTESVTVETPEPAQETEQQSSVLTVATDEPTPDESITTDSPTDTTSDTNSDATSTQQDATSTTTELSAAASGVDLGGGSATIPDSEVIDDEVATTTSTVGPTYPEVTQSNGIVYQQLDDTAHSQELQDRKYLVQTYIHKASDPAWSIKEIKLRFKPIYSDGLTENDCKMADITFPQHGGDWNGTQNNISGVYSSQPWKKVIVTADNITMTCTYAVNFGTLVDFSAGVDYDMVFSSAGSIIEVYGSPTDVTPGMFGDFSYGDLQNPIADINIADAYFILATSTSQVIPPGITPLVPQNISTSTSSINFSGTYRDMDGSFNRLGIQVEATSTANQSSMTRIFEIPAVAGEAIPFSQMLDFPVATTTTGMRWRVQSWDYSDWGSTGNDTPWNGATGYSDWQYFTFEPAPDQIIQTAPQPPALSSEKSIISFSLAIGATTTSGVIDDATHAINITVPFGTDVSTLVPSIALSPQATSIPVSGAKQDFTNPVNYLVTAEDGSTQQYTVMVTVAPDPTQTPPPVVPDNTLPVILSYTLNGAAADVTTDFGTTTPTVTLNFTANKNVDWVSITIEDQNNSARNKIFFSGAGCVDGTATCTKTWTGDLSHGSIGPDTIYRIKVNMKDAAGNIFDDYLSPYRIIVQNQV